MGGQKSLGFALTAIFFIAGSPADLMGLLFVLVIVAVIGFCGSGALLIIWTWRN
jgi:hypothetical protein